jgi:hypothetical protein
MTGPKPKPLLLPTLDGTVSLSIPAKAPATARQRRAELARSISARLGDLDDSHDPEIPTLWELRLDEINRRPPLTCCANHGRGVQTPDGRTWCWSPSSSSESGNDKDRTGLLCERICQSAVRWREAMERQIQGTR